MSSNNTPTGEYMVRYVGQSIHPHERYRQHVQRSQNEIYKDVKNYCSRWLQKLARLDIKPKLDIVAEVFDEFADHAEIFFISHYKALNAKWNHKQLTNGNAGGFGGKGASDTMRANMSKAHKGKKFSPETCKKISINSSRPRGPLPQSHKDAFSKGHKKRKRRITNPCMPILQYDKDGNFLAEWESGKLIQRTLNYCHRNIGKCCKVNAEDRDKNQKSYGFIWKYKNPDDPKNAELSENAIRGSNLYVEPETNENTTE